MDKIKSILYYYKRKIELITNKKEDILYYCKSNKNYEELKKSAIVFFIFGMLIILFGFHFKDTQIFNIVYAFSEIVIVAIICLCLYIFVFNNIKNEWRKVIIYVIIDIIIIAILIGIIVKNILLILFTYLLIRAVEKFENVDTFLSFLVLTVIRFTIFMVFFKVLIIIGTNEYILNTIFCKLENIINEESLKNIVLNLDLNLDFLSLSISYLISNIVKWIFKCIKKHKNQINVEIICNYSKKFDWICFVLGFMYIIFLCPEEYKQYQSDYINIMTSFTLIDLLISKLLEKKIEVRN